MSATARFMWGILLLMALVFSYKSEQECRKDPVCWDRAQEAIR